MSYRALLWVGWLAWAQPLPKEIIFRGISGDSAKALCRSFSGGWVAEKHKRIGTDWYPVQRDSFLVDTQRRLVGYYQYDILPSGGERAAERWRLDYPSQGRLIVCTVEGYDTVIGTFVPRQRLYLWGASLRWDSVLRGWIGVLGLGWQLDRGALLLPQPTLSDMTLWGDSLLIEAYLPSAQVYVATSGYVRRAGSGCDTVFWYELQGSQRLPQAWRALCPSGGNALTYSWDSVCSPTACTAEERFIAYDVNGYLVLDSSVVRTYDAQGQLVSTGGLMRRYEWDAEGRLSRAFYAGGEYKLSYDGQVVSLAYDPKASEECPGEEVSLYDWQMRLLWRGKVEANGRVALPEGLSAGIYLLRRGESVKKIHLIFP